MKNITADNNEVDKGLTSEGSKERTIDDWYEVVVPKA